ncbi:MAG TPA: hypothetical protein VF252_10205 [Gemmatimonadales bacterium]
MPHSRRPDWLIRIETLGTTLTVLLVGGMMIWYEAIEHGAWLAVTISSAAILYVAGIVLAGLRSDPQRIAWWPFVLSGSVAGAVAELINAQFVVTRELFLAAVTGVVIGTAHWTALWIWIRLNERRPA